MKTRKILSILVAICMICSFVNVTAFGYWEEVAETKRFELYNWTTIYGDTLSNPEIGNYVYAETGANEASSTVYITGEFSLSAKESGYYDVTYLLGYMNNATATSPVTVSVDGVAIGKNNVMGIDMTNVYKKNTSYNPMHKYVKHALYLGEGTHKVEYAIEPSGNNRCFFQADWIEFVPSVNPRFEFEDYYAPNVYGRGTENVWAWQATSVGGATENKTVSIPVKIEETGSYNITYLAGYKKTASALTITLVDAEGNETTIGTNAKEGEDLTAIYTNLTSNAPMHKYSVEKAIEAGDYTLNIVFEPTSNQRRIFNFDYIEFNFLGGAEDGPQKFEFADWTTSYVKTSATEEVGTYLKAELGTGQSGVVTVSKEITLSETEDAYYNLTYLMSYMKNATAASPLTLSIDGTVIGKNNVVGVDMTELYTSLTTYIPMQKYVKNGLWLEKGAHTVELAIDISANSRRMFQADWIQFERAENTRIDFEDYYAPNVKGRGTENIWAWEATGVDTVTENKEITIPVKITETATYDVTYLIGYKKVASALSLKLVDSEGNEIAIGTNAKEGEDLSETYAYLQTNAPMHKYVVEDLEIAAGDYNLVVVAEPTSNGRRILQLDYIQFAPPVKYETGMKLENGVANVTVAYDEAVSGTPVLALYNGNQLVKTFIGDAVEGVNGVVFTEECAETVNKAKVFIWGDTVTIAPQATNTIFAD